MAVWGYKGFTEQGKNNALRWKNECYTGWPESKLKGRTLKIWRRMTRLGR